MKGLAKLAAAFLIPGGILVAGFLVVRAFMKIRAAITSGDPRFDQFQSRLTTAVMWKGAPASLSSDTAIHYGRALMAILHNENTASWDGSSPVIGDKDSPGGPSIGPMQVYRATAIDLGFVPSNETPETYMSRAADVDWCIDAGTSVFFAKLHTVGGDIAEAIRAYNGSGTAAETYKGDALSWLMQQYGDDPIGPSPA